MFTLSNLIPNDQHGAKLSPDGNLLVVTDNGIEIVDHRVQWKSFVSPRKDRLVVFKLQAA